MTEENKEKEIEDEVITFKDIVERNSSLKEEEIYKIVLICKNCGHKDLLRNFIKRNDTYNMRGDIINPFKPYPQRISPSRKYMTQTMKILSLDNKDFDDLFYCPKCNSSLVVLCKEFSKNNILRGLS